MTSFCTNSHTKALSAQEGAEDTDSSWPTELRVGALLAHTACLGGWVLPFSLVQAQKGTHWPAKRP